MFDTYSSLMGGQVALKKEFFISRHGLDGIEILSGVYYLG